MSSETSTFGILKRLPSESNRILKLSRKPTRLEFEEVAKITGLGIALLGAIGYFFIFLKSLLQSL
ncbi:MAG: protein translocase SEC61 complex subunit gamma [Candidatus Altiarchaeota archaeon]|nr:protein translocase SEC61 complex subunit gamma [Candidatus Altiarchaeota archaeon]